MEPPKPSLKTNPMLIGLVVIVLILLGFGFYAFNTQNKVKKTVFQSTLPVVKVSTGSAAVGSPPEGVSKNPIQLTGTIRLTDQKLGCWAIEPQPVSGSPSYQVINMPTVLKKAGIVATFSLEVQSETVTTCKTGPEVRILNYEILSLN